MIRFLCHYRKAQLTCIHDDGTRGKCDPHTQGTVEEAAMTAKRAAAQARATAAAADEQAAEALFADAQTANGLPPSSPWADAFAADALKVNARLAEARFADSLSEDGLVKETFGQQKISERSGGAREQQQQQLPQTVGAGLRVGIVGGAASAAPAAASGSVARTGRPASRSSLSGRDDKNTRTTAIAAAPEREGTIRNTATKPVTPVPEVTSRLKTSDREAPLLDRRAGGTVEEGGSNPTESRETIANDHGDGLGTRSDPEGGFENPSKDENVVSGAAAEVEQQQEQQWVSMTVVALKDELRQRGLKVSGKKAELVERLLRA